MHTIIYDHGQWRAVFAWPMGGSETVVAVFDNPNDAAKLVNYLNGGDCFYEKTATWVGTSSAVLDA